MRPVSGYDPATKAAFRQWLKAHGDPQADAAEPPTAAETARLLAMALVQRCVTREKFDFIKRCPCSRGALGCGYTILNLGFGCPYDCSYCYLQFYQNTPAILLYANPEDFCRELDLLFQKKGPAVRRLGTGEFTDSLALDRVTEYSKILVPYFKDKPCWFELKTKSACVENLLGLEHGGRTVVSWSLSLERHAREETGAPPVAERLRSARRAEAALYPVAFHFDPIFYEPGWEGGYEELVNCVFDEIRTVPRWISLGAFRCHRDLKRAAEARHPQTRIFLGEQVPEGASGKFQYPERFRVEIYRKMLAWIRKRSPRSKVYLCMEPPEVWGGVFGSVPKGRLGDWLAE
jgi:spore photoproduct lyase